MGLVRARLVLSRLLQGLADVNLLDLHPAGPGGVPVARLHPLVRDASRHHPDTTTRRGDYEATTAVLLHTAAYAGITGLPEDPTTWPMWQALAPHAFHLRRTLTTSTDPRPATLACAAAALAARYLTAQGLYTNAHTELAAILDTLRCIGFGDDHPDTLTTRHELANVLTWRGEYATAETEYQAILDARRRTGFGDDHPDTLATRRALTALRDR